TASNNTSNNRVGLIATKGTVESRAYEIAIKNINPRINLFSYAAPKLVELIEAGVLEGTKLQEVISGYVDPLIKENIDVLILGCTHFPLIEKQIISKYSGDFKVISSAVETAKDVKSTMEKFGLPNERAKGSCGINGAGSTCIRKGPERTYYETGNASKFLEVGRMFLGGEINEVVRVKLDMGQ
ncbi:MAG TPA: aspartate/glutamate racemase family protein, partial [Candidatus Humimicrobiaceae bacterium]